MDVKGTVGRCYPVLVASWLSDLRSQLGAEREWRNRQTRTVQVRVPARAWGFNSPLAHPSDFGSVVGCGITLFVWSTNLLSLIPGWALILDLVLTLE